MRNKAYHHHYGNLIACILVENDSFLEMRDCFVHSVKDLAVIELEKDIAIRAQLEGE